MIHFTRVPLTLINHVHGHLAAGHLLSDVHTVYSLCHCRRVAKYVELTPTAEVVNWFTPWKRAYTLIAPWNVFAC